MYKLLKYGSPNLIEALANLKKKALRKGIWFQTLSTNERVLASLIGKYVKIVKNSALATVIARIIVKLIYGIKNSFIHMIESRGRPIAESWARAACAMGWKDASKWVEDINILRWYGFTAYYSKGGSWPRDI